jgi:acyl-CoA thioesterase-1
VSKPIAAWLRRALLCVLLIAGSAAAAAPAAILVLGDSLSAEYGLPRDTGWVRLLADRMAKEGAQYSVVNASISGETTSGGRSRLPQLLEQHRPAIVVLQLGGNDGLRGLPPAAMRDNLAAMIAASRRAGAQVLLIGMRMPPNYGRDYAERFAAVYGQLARDEKLPLVPFLLDGFAEDLTYFQADRIHPSERAQPRMLETVWPRLAPLIRGKGGAGTPRVRLNPGPAPAAA